MTPLVLLGLVAACLLVGYHLGRSRPLEATRNYVWWQINFEPISSSRKGWALVLLFLAVHPVCAIRTGRKLVAGL